MMKFNEITMEHMLKNAPAVIGFARNRTIQWVNYQLLDMFGYKEDDITGKSTRILYDSDEEFERVGSVLYREKKGRGSVFTRWKHIDGDFIDIQLDLNCVNHNDYTEGVIFTAIDIRELKKVEKELRGSKERFSQIFYFSPQIVALSTISEGRYLDVNDAFLKITGYKREEVIGRTVMELNIWAEP
ncbi:MAG: PAS domain-containing protein, partial [Candidatus Eremiobacterota bacterium]